MAEGLRGDGYGLGVSFSVTDNITIAASIDSEGGADDQDAVDAVDAVAATNSTPKTKATKAQLAGDDPDQSRTGIAVNAKFGGYWVNFGLQNHVTDENERTGADETDIATNFLYVGGSFAEKTSWLVGTSQSDDGNSETEEDPSQITWGVYHNLGSGLRLYVESHSRTAGGDDTGRSILGMRFDF